MNKDDATRLEFLTKELNEKLHEPTDNETRWKIIRSSLLAAYNDGLYRGKQE